jgi:formylglycine-generating enzyme required for sulfatase activity
VTVTVLAPSSNADLSTLTVNAGALSPAFLATTMSYAVNVANSVDRITVTGTSADKNATIGTKNGVTQNLSVGSNPIDLTVTAQNGTTTKKYTVTVSRAPAAITLLAIPGVVAPVTGMPPVAAITATDQYTGTVSWAPSVTTFLGAQPYTATIVLSAKAGFTFDGVAVNSFVVAGSSSAIYGVNPGVVIAQFPATAAAVVNVGTILGIVAPVKGAAPVTTAIDNSQYSGTIIWNPVNNPFAAATVYTATILLSAKAGFTFEGIAANFFTVAGATATTNLVNSGVVTAAFPATAMLTMVSVPAGTFQRDATAANTSSVSAFRMSAHEITREQFLLIMGTDPSEPESSSGMSDPVQRVNWYYAIAFCNKLSIAEGLTPVYSISGSTEPATWGAVPSSSNATWDAVAANRTHTGYRLPTEMEWMWAAMGASDVATGYSKAFSGSNGNNMIGNYAVFGSYGSEIGRTATMRSNPVGSKTANELGLYDLSGNVLEWCWDWDGAYPNGAASQDYTGPTLGTTRDMRGGSWVGGAFACPVAYRSDNGPNYRSEDVGFRVVRR